jgi:pyruvate carboxylase subunit B
VVEGRAVKYHVTVGGNEWVVEVDGGQVLVDGTPWEAHFAPIPGTPLWHLLLGRDSWTIAAQALDGPGRWALGLAGERYDVSVVDERTRAIQQLTGRRPATDGGGIVRAPMPGLVVRVEAEPGQRVAAGAGLVVVEAMKMENELRAAREARVAAVHVRAGQTVEKGAPLVTLESVEPSG